MFEEKKILFDVVRESDNKYWLAKVELKESSCFSYGNGTRVELSFNNGDVTGYDTRYDSRVITDFEGFAFDLLKGYCTSDCIIMLHQR